MDALVTYSSSESGDDECHEYLSHWAVLAGSSVAANISDIMRTEDLTVLPQRVNEAVHCKPRAEGRVLSAVDVSPEQMKNIEAKSTVTSATEQLDVSIAESSIRYAKEDCLELVECGNDSVNESSAASAVEDYFGLAELGCATEADDTPDAPFMTDLQQKPAGENVCTVDFWKTDVAADDWAHPENIWGTMTDVTESKPHCASRKIMNSASDNTVSEIKQYSSKRCQPDISSESLDSTNSPLMMKKSCFTVHHKLAPHLNTSTESINRSPKKIFRVLPGHSGTVNRIHWNVPEYSHLLLTASMDSTVRVWNVLSARDSDPCVQTLQVHSKAVKSARWSACGRQILSCSYDKFAKLTDVECGMVSFSVGCSAVLQ